MKVVEVIALNEKKYDKILLLKRPANSSSYKVEDMEETYIFSDMAQVNTEYFDIELDDYFLLDNEGLRDIVFSGSNHDFDIKEDDMTLVLIF